MMEQDSKFKGILKINQKISKESEFKWQWFKGNGYRGQGFISFTFAAGSASNSPRSIAFSFPSHSSPRLP